MADISKGHFAEGWQKANTVKKDEYSDRIRQEGKSTLENAKLTEQQAQVAKALQSAKVGQTNAPEIQKPQTKGNEAPKAKPEANISKEESQRNAQNSAATAAKASAAGLGKLEGRANLDITRASESAVANGVRDAKTLVEPRAAKTDATKAVATPDARVLAENVTRNAQRGTRSTSKETENKKDKPEQNNLTKQAADIKDQKDLKKMDVNPLLNAQVAQASSQVSTTRSESKGEVREKNESKDKEIRTDKTESSGAYATRSGSEPNAQKELNTLLGGNAGGNDSGEGEKDLAEVVNVARAPVNEIPQTYPGLTVYNEQTKGTEVRERAQVYKTFVEKRLKDIAKVDEEIGQKIESLTVRVIGELKDQIKAADFLYSTIYGGLRG